jgi:predicted MFS family arabinose efflux permease
LNDTTPRMRPRAKWTAFSFLALWGYLLYGLGNATPYLRDDLRLTAFEAGLHASALALGVLVAGATADILGRRVGMSRLFDLSIAYFAVAVALIVLAPGLPVSLCGAFLLGLGGGTLGTQVNVELSRFGQAQSRILLSQANAFSMIVAAAAPLAIGLAASVLHAWHLAMLLPIVGGAALTVLRPRERVAAAAVHAPKVSLPRSYWIVWLLLVIGVSIEFSFVVWGSTIVMLRTGISTADATLVASLFVVGMFAGRTVVGSGVGSGRSSLALLAAGLVVVLVGAALTWISTTPILSGFGLLLGGCGVAGLWPIGVTVALHTAGVGQLQAAARATLGAGLAILIAPATLGLAGDAVGITAAWPIIMGMAACGLGVVALAHRIGRQTIAAG